MTADRCTGHCCRSFTIPYGPGELLRSYVAAEGLNDPGENKNLLKDIETIWPMLIWQGYLPTESGLRMHHYGCRNLQADGNCGVYESRPAMCRDFPYGKACPFDECTWESAPRTVPVDRLTRAVTP